MACALGRDTPRISSVSGPAAHTRLPKAKRLPRLGALLDREEGLAARQNVASLLAWSRRHQIPTVELTFGPLPLGRNRTAVAASFARTGDPDVFHPVWEEADTWCDRFMDEAKRTLEKLLTIAEKEERQLTLTPSSHPWFGTSPSTCADLLDVFAGGPISLTVATGSLARRRFLKRPISEELRERLSSNVTTVVATDTVSLRQDMALGLGHIGAAANLSNLSGEAEVKGWVASYEAERLWARQLCRQAGTQLRLSGMGDESLSELKASESLLLQ